MVHHCAKVILNILPGVFSFMTAACRHGRWFLLPFMREEINQEIKDDGWENKLK